MPDNQYFVTHEGEDLSFDEELAGFIDADASFGIRPNN
jgi:hypothetical protein